MPTAAVTSAVANSFFRRITVAQEVNQGEESREERATGTGEEPMAQELEEEVPPAALDTAADDGDAEEPEEEERLDTEAEVEEVTPTTRRIKGRVPAEKIKKIFKENWRELGEQVTRRGFRKGRVPRRMLERLVGSKLNEELEKNLKDAAVKEVAKDRGLFVVGQPEFTRAELADGAPFEFEATVEVVPDFALPPLEDIEVAREPITVSDEEVQAQLDHIRNERADLVVVEQWPPSEKDVVIAATKVTAGGKVIAQNEGNAIVVGRNELYGLTIEGLSAKLLAGEKTIVCELQVPEDNANERLRARRVKVEIEVKEVKRPKPPEVTDEWAALFKCASAAELKTKISERIRAEKDRAEDMALGRRAFDKILERVTFPIPEGVKKRIEEYAPKALPDLEAISREQTAEAEGAAEKSEDELKAEEAARAEKAEKERKAIDASAELREAAEKMFRRQVVLERLAESYKIEVTDEDVDTYIQMAQGVRGRDLVELKRRLEARGVLREIVQELLGMKVQDHLRRNCRIASEDGKEEAKPEGAGAPPASEEARQ